MHCNLALSRSACTFPSGTLPTFASYSPAHPIELPQARSLLLRVHFAHLFSRLTLDTSSEPRSHISPSSLVPLSRLSCARGLTTLEQSHYPPFKHLCFPAGLRTRLGSRTHGLAKPTISSSYNDFSHLLVARVLSIRGLNLC